MSKSGGIALLILGLLVLGVSYYVKTDADSGFDQAQCGNILGAVVGALYTPEAQACQHAQMMSTPNNTTPSLEPQPELVM